MNKIKFAVFIRAEKPKFICGQIVGADGCGEKVKLISGDDAKCREKVNALIDYYKSKYLEVDIRVVEQEETFSGNSISILEV